MRTCDTELIKVDADWTLVKNECRTTVNKEATPNEPSSDFKFFILLAEHSPIRLVRVHWRWGSIKSWIATHFARHWLGWNKWIGTRRSDRIAADRDSLRQDELVPMDVEANAQSLINVSRFRLCYQAAVDTREYMEDVKCKIAEVQPELAMAMVPNCIYRGGCPEMTSCGFYDKFVANHPNEEFSDLLLRYSAYQHDWEVRHSE